MANQKFDQLMQELVDHVYSNEPSSEQSLELARYALLDSIGCALAALDNEPCKQLLSTMKFTLGASNGARVPGAGEELGPIEAAFQIGTLIRWLEFNDTWLAQEWGHPSDNLGAILAVADWVSRNNRIAGREPVSMRTVLDVMVKVYEVHGVLCLENCFNKLGIDHVIFVKVASSIAASVLLGLSREQALNALSNAFIDGHSLRTYRHAPNAGTRKSWAAGDATARGVQLALFSQAGEMGYPSALSTPRWGFNDAVFQGKEMQLGRPLEEYVIENILFKVPNPAEYHAQTAVEGAIKLHAFMHEKGLVIDDISEIFIETQKPAMQIINKVGVLGNPADRDHCLQYMVAVAALNGDLTIEDFDGPIAFDPRVDQLRDKIRCEEKPEYTANYYAPDKRSIGNTLTVRFKTQVEPFVAAIEYPVGHRVRRSECLPLLVQKFTANASVRYGSERSKNIEKLITSSSDLEGLAADDFMQLLA
ncbi:bifunctional 2-methylcitrate dehydratase/aconitate hydratase [Pseudomonas sp. B21-015]|uniref:bifunctional 2-methylcitrate dehydratase/aconitate hydratase n=1 Tax=Pseudomonas sp. B21-015 TaxID=2895473 RepID=UPI00215EB558|nr:bifunctional 2-methylcitrate dehydratase/aconitate hydratase [Pseudomonas sp. B21-015]